jgi:putative oxidoreductase
MPAHATDFATLSFGLLLARLVIGPLMAAHGAQKLFGWFGGPGLNGAGQFMSQLGFRPGRAFAAIASLTELVSGVLVTLGLLGPIGPALMLSVMITAAVTVHLKNGVFAMKNGIEVPLLYAAVAVGLAFTGFGEYSADALLGIAAGPALTGIVVALGAMGAIGNLALRRPVSAAART